MSVYSVNIFEDYASVLKDFKAYEEELLRFSKLIGYENFNLQNDGTIRIAHYIGFYSSGNLRLQILPKLYSKTDLYSDSSTEIKQSVAFVIRLLAESGYFKYKQIDPLSITSISSDLLEIFIFIFSNEFNQLIKKRIHKQYIQFEETQQFIKGKILFSETINLNGGLNHIHCIRYDEYSINNTLNRIFKSILLKLLVSTRESINKKLITENLTHLEGVDIICLTPDVFMMIRFDRLNMAFQPLFNLAKLFYYNLQPGLSSGREYTFSFLVPLNDLFEYYISKALIELNNEDYTFCYHLPCEPLATINGKPTFILKPDFTLIVDNQVMMILDAKYKFPFDDDGNVCIKTTDLYQLCTYALHYQCESLTLIYPMFKGITNFKNHLATFKIPTVSGNIDLHVIQLDIIDNSIDETKESLKLFIKEICLNKSKFTTNCVNVRL